MAIVKATNNKNLQSLLKSKAMQKAAGIVLRKTKFGIVMTARPLRNGRNSPHIQTPQQARLTEAVAYAQDVVSDDEKVIHYMSMLAPAESVSQRAFNNYMEKGEMTGKNITGWSYTFTGHHSRFIRQSIAG
ncbi:MAG: hypothetical protein ABJA70_10980 [Chryseolinea sp.]